MIEQKRLALWLRQLAGRTAGVPDAQHIAQLRAAASDPTWTLYLDAISDGLTRGASYGSAIANPMGLDLSEELQEKLHAASTSTAVDAMLLDAAFALLLNISDHSHLKSMLDRAEYRYSQHRDHSRGPGPYDIDVYTAMTESYPGDDLTGETVNMSFTFTDAGELNGIRSYFDGASPGKSVTTWRRSTELCRHSEAQRAACRGAIMVAYANHAHPK